MTFVTPHAKVPKKHLLSIFIDYNSFVRYRLMACHNTQYLAC